LLVSLDSPGAQDTLRNVKNAVEDRLENKLFWPAMAVITVVLAVRNLSRLGQLNWPPHIICLAAYLAFAGTSALWAFNPAVSFTRFGTETIMVASIVVPAMLAARTTDLMRGLFLAFAFGSILHLLFVLNQPPIVGTGVYAGIYLGFPGYFTDKNGMGEYASIAFLLALHEATYSGFRRVFGLIITVIAASLVVLSNSKTSLGFAVLSPLVAALVVVTGKKMRISPAMVLLPIPILYYVVSKVAGNIFNRVSYMIYSNYTFSGRTDIWNFVRNEIDRRPLLGWGYQSFWKAGPDSPSLIDAGGWIKQMPHGHNGYLDANLETGLIGLVFLIVLIFATLHAAGRLVDRDPARAWLVLTIVLYNILTNFLETSWMRGAHLVWLVFLFAVAEIGRYWQPFHAAGRHGRQRVQQHGLDDHRLRGGRVGAANFASTRFSSPHPRIRS
jgi:O-antigen ligase